jgi:glycosyltransferase involved in cell wall biosynthesis
VTRVLYLAYHFPPLGGGGVQRNAAFVRRLSELGFTCVVITGPATSNDRWAPLDETMRSEIPDDLEVHRLTGPEPDLSGSRAKLEWRLMFRPSWSRWWEHGALSAAHEVGRVDLIYASLVPYDMAEGVATVAHELRRPWVADLQDPWALDEMWPYPTRLHRNRDRRRMRSLLATASAVVMNTPEAARRVVAAFPELGSKLITAIPNGFDDDDFRGSVPERRDGKFRIVHTGYLHTEDGRRLARTRLARTLLGGFVAPVDILPRSHVYLLQALDKIVNDDAAAARDLDVVLAGVTTEIDRKVAAGRAFIRMPGYMSHRDAVELLRSADLLFLPMHDLPAGMRAGLVPGKTYEYLAAARPILAAVPDGDARDLLEEAGSADLCRPTDSARMAQLIMRRLRHWRSGQPRPVPPRPDVIARYERRYLGGQLACVLRGVLDASGDDPCREGVDENEVTM